MRRTTALLCSAALYGYGCAAQVGAEGEDLAADERADDYVESEVGASSSALTQAQLATAVGVIPTNFHRGESGGGDFGSTCPSGSDLVTIRMDDEDDNNVTSITTWLTPANTGQSTGTVEQCLYWDGTYPGTSSGSPCNTTVTACRVDGTKLKSITNGTNSAYFYAVLKLGTTCPNGSVDVERYIDNEDDDNQNSSSGSDSIAPNVSNTNTRLKFCYFKGNFTNNMTSFPDFGGKHYAVFHPFDGVQPSWVLEKRFAYSDDEDENNTDGRVPANFPVWGLNNTRFDMARVR